jgi:hypothetical protein
MPCVNESRGTPGLDTWYFSRSTANEITRADGKVECLSEVFHVGGDALLGVLQSQGYPVQYEEEIARLWDFRVVSGKALQWVHDTGWVAIGRGEFIFRTRDQRYDLYKGEIDCGTARAPRYRAYRRREHSSIWIKDTCPNNKITIEKLEAMGHRLGDGDYNGQIVLVDQQIADLEGTSVESRPRDGLNAGSCRVTESDMVSTTTRWVPARSLDEACADEKQYFY